MKIVLDAGHGINTPGKRVPDGSMREFEFNSKVAALAKGLLEGYENVEVIFTHDPTGKVDIPLGDRTNKANKEKANVYVSIHANAFGSGDFNNAEGVETFIYTTKPAEALELASRVQNQLLRHTGRKNRGVKAANYHVLRETHMTAILVECGFMTNKEEADLLKSDSYRIKCTQAIVAGLVEQYKLKEKPKPKPKPTSNVLYKVQVGAFSDEANAKRLADQLKDKGFPVYIIKE